MSSTATSCPAWSIPAYLEVRNGHLNIDGVDALELVAKYNSPLFVFSERRIRHNIERLQHAASVVDRPIKFCYASKANSNMAILKAVLESGIDVEVNSGGELFKALRVGFRPDQIIFNGTSKSDDELDDAVRAGIYAINIDSMYEIELVEQSVERLRAHGEDVAPARITLRLVPEIGTRSHLGLQTALLTSKFGISSSEVLAAFRRGLQQPDLIRVCGIHIHVGSQTPDVEPFAEAFKSMWEHLVTIHNETGHTLEHINLGGGISKSFLRETEMAAHIFKQQVLGHKYAIQIAADSPHPGGRSSAVVFDEPQVYGKLARNALTAYVNCDATIALPIIITALSQTAAKYMKGRRRPNFTFAGKDLIIEVP